MNTIIFVLIGYFSAQIFLLFGFLWYVVNKLNNIHQEKTKEMLRLMQVERDYQYVCEDLEKMWSDWDELTVKYNNLDYNLEKMIMERDSAYRLGIIDAQKIYNWIDWSTIPEDQFVSCISGDYQNILSRYDNGEWYIIGDILPDKMNIHNGYKHYFRGEKS